MQVCTKEKEISEIRGHLVGAEELLARIDERQKNHDRVLRAINRQTKLTNGRVTKLESWRTLLAGVSVGVNAVLAAVVAGLGLVGKFF